MREWFTTTPAGDSGEGPVTGTISTRMIFALRERLEEEGLSKSLQAENLDRAIVQNREFVLKEMQPLFRQMDRSNIDRSTDHRFWWWRLDDERVFQEVSARLSR